MKNSIKFYLDGKGEPKQIFANISFAGKRVRLFTGYRINKDNFSTDKQEVHKNANGLFGKQTVKYNLINNKLREIATEVTRFIDPLTSLPTKEDLATIINKTTCKVEKVSYSESLLFWDMYESYLAKQNNKNTRKQHNASKNHLKSFEEYKGIRFSFDNITAELLEEWKEWLIKDSDKNADKTTRTARGLNTIACTFKNARAFFNWAIDEIKKRNRTTELKTAIPNNPFNEISDFPKEKYSKPIYLTIQERDTLYQFNGTDRENLVRDLFVFQCLSGCRVGDLLRLSKDNVRDNVLSYIPQKTLNEKEDTVNVPLSPLALEIISHYPDEQQLFPYIVDVNYNRLLKTVAEKAGLNRTITRLNPRTRKEEHRPLYEIISSHMARKTFIGSLYGDVKDAVICAMSGHKEGGKAFYRYRQVSDEMKMEAVKVLETKATPKDRLLEKLSGLSESDIEKLLSKL